MTAAVIAPAVPSPSSSATTLSLYPKDLMPNSPVPDFSVAVAMVFEFLGAHPILITIILLAFALESWYSNLGKIAKGARVGGRFVARAAGHARTRPPIRITVAVFGTATVLIIQVFMARLSYIGGSLIATPFDGARRDMADQALSTTPTLFVDAEYLRHFLRTDWISTVYVLWSITMILLAYRPSANIGLLWAGLTTPFWLIALGSMTMVLISVVCDLFFAGLSALASRPPAWTFIESYVLQAPYLTLAVVSSVYCVAAAVATKGARVVTRLWRPPFSGGASTTPSGTTSHRSI